MRILAQVEVLESQKLARSPAIFRGQRLIPSGGALPRSERAFPQKERPVFPQDWRNEGNVPAGDVWYVGLKAVKQRLSVPGRETR